MVSPRVAPGFGGADVADARRISDAERALGEIPAGCTWLDARTVDDLDLPLVFRAIDRTATPTGAQVLWRWLAAPAADVGLLAARERALAVLADRALRDRITNELAGAHAVDAPLLPRLLWEPAATPPRTTWPLAVLAAAIGCALLAWWLPILVVPLLVLGVAALAIDSWLHHQLAPQANALEVLCTELDRAARVVAACPSELAGDVARDLAVRAALRKRIALLTARDPFELLELARAALLIRVFTVRSCMRIVEAERAALRRTVLWLGEIDALCSIARLRAERSDARVPELAESGIVARALVHPAVDHAIGNALTLAPALLVTGSNMSGKSTLLRTVAVNAILAQSIHTVFGAWRAPLVRVRAVMRIGDDIERGMSTYAVEVASIGELVTTTRGDLPTLFVIDEPFHGTNPAVRVPIVVAVLEHLAAGDLVIAATHDLEVARLISPAFARAHFAELPTGGVDRTLRPGVATATNAVELLARAGYPTELLARVARLRG